ncbi:outer membrane beta-barrel protein [Helicobacter cetorum]|uniref:outer membrane beta-barrel protein n=1 Tax=Helicobacter cetorum TaxID=138563 RepID=UPI000CF1A794|nr:outer membrane beta-barrel protein [Helicobacter cetorum]
MHVKKAVLFLSLMNICFAEENGAYASVGFQYSLMHAVQKNDPFSNQERIATIINAQNNIAQLKKIENQVKQMPKTFQYINSQLKKPTTPQEQQESLEYIQSLAKNIEKVLVISHSSNPALIKELQAISQAKNLQELEPYLSHLPKLEQQFAQAQNAILSNLSNQIAEISNSINAMPTSPSSATISNMFGVSLNVGYKHFFGKTKRHGFRYYLFYDYGYSNPSFIGNGITSLGKMNNNVYGLGIDYLFNFIDNNKTHFTTGFYFGFAISGSSWVGKGASAWISQMDFINNYLPNYNANMHTSYFQIPLEWGIRTNIDRHNGFEIGIKIPLAINSYFESHGKGLNSALFFKRSVVFNVNYVYNF